MATYTRNAITLEGSAAIITDYLKYAINAIIFQRDIYPPEQFNSVQQYGLTILMWKNDMFNSKLQGFLLEARALLTRNEIEKITLTIENMLTSEVLEKWEFTVHSESPIGTTSKPLKKIKADIRIVLRQIAATISYLPALECSCKFDLSITVPKGCHSLDHWITVPVVHILNAQTVQLKSFSTGLQKVDTIVEYKLTD
ncbi:mitotic spindle assembly checkpoint protein MAD2A-like [Wyeomyia smithii]|uniref:mitotic spindle assembly checkpoint protein MAD2A-like n=1 Tax=Wyeomyia smithii TaxID=174621 RepID=UPI002467B791|nr:mitotic spindle assembly checkpoint protein MAD2A-like [Wyeomyia smithii]